MPIAKAESKAGFDPLPAGVHQAACYAVIDLGTQDPGNPTFKASRKVMLMWETPHETIVVNGETKPRAISCEYTLSLGKKANLRSVLESWRGKPFTAEELEGFDLKNIVGRNCQLNVVHKPGKADPSKVYARIQGVIPLSKGMAPVAPVNPTIVFDIPETGDIKIPKEIPEWIAGKIQQSEEYKARHGNGHTEAVQVPAAPDDEDRPF
jgi:hypothetical protein